MAHGGAQVDDRIAPTSPPVNRPSPESLYRRHRPGLVNLASVMLDDREQAAEVVQDAFAELITGWHTIDPDRALAYLYRSVINRSRSWLRRRRTARSFRADALMMEPGADVQVIRVAVYTQVAAAVRALTPAQEHVVVLRYYRELSVADTSAALGMSENAVNVNLHRALKTLSSLRAQLL